MSQPAYNPLYEPPPLTPPPGWKRGERAWWIRREKLLQLAPRFWITTPSPPGFMWRDYGRRLYPIPARAKGKIRTLSFEDAGRAIRILLREFGVRPYRNFIRVPPKIFTRMERRDLDYRLVLWDARSEPSKECAEKAATALVAAGITDFRLTPGGWFKVRIPRDCFACSFYSSDDPLDWTTKDKQRHNAIARRKKICETLAALDGVA
jgi:hypothetical protein